MALVKKHRFPGVFRIEEREHEAIATQSLAPGTTVYGEKLVTEQGKEYRVWSPRRSKLAAAIRKGISEMPIRPGSRLLYLGAASGTTVSHCSDIVGSKGMVYAVEFSQRTARELINLAASRENIIPVVEDVRHPTRYAPFVGPVEIVYQDVAQPNQAEILYQNMRTFCSFGAWGMLAIKARSIDSATDIDTIYNQELTKLEENGLEIVENIDLNPLEKDHRFVVCRATKNMT